MVPAGAARVVPPAISLPQVQREHAVDASLPSLISPVRHAPASAVGHVLPTRVLSKIQEH